MLNKNIAIIISMLFLASCGNPGDISDEDYKKYKDLGAPKLLYSCTREYPWVLVCALEGGKTSEECIDEAVKTDRLTEQVTHSKVGYSAGIGMGATYNKLLTEAKEECEGEFKILESKE